MIIHQQHAQPLNLRAVPGVRKVAASASGMVRVIRTPWSGAAWMCGAPPTDCARSCITARP